MFDVNAQTCQKEKKKKRSAKTEIPKFSRNQGWRCQAHVLFEPHPRSQGCRVQGNPRGLQVTGLRFCTPSVFCLISADARPC